jgi:hypothetical protein
MEKLEVKKVSLKFSLNTEECPFSKMLSILEKYRISFQISIASNIVTPQN